MRKPVSSYRTLRPVGTDYREKYGCEGLPGRAQMAMRNLLPQAEEKGMVSENGLHKTDAGGVNKSHTASPSRGYSLEGWGINKEGASSLLASGDGVY